MPERIHSYSSLRGCKQIVAWFALAVFSVQLVRFYVVVPSDAYTCSEPGHHHGAGELAHGVDHYGEDLLPQGDVDQTYFQHCKETLDGLWLTPAQPLGMPVFSADRIEPHIPLRLPQLMALPIDNAIPPPFQPPRNFD